MTGPELSNKYDQTRAETPTRLQDIFDFYLESEYKDSIKALLQRKTDEDSYDKITKWYKEWNMKQGGSKDAILSYELAMLLCYIEKKVLEDLGEGIIISKDLLKTE